MPPILREAEPQRSFACPSVDHGAFPFWFWNGDLNPDELVRQVREMHSKGLGGFIIHCRLGCQVPYLSEQWFDRCRVVIEEAARQGMKVWLYDEDNWPSGYAGGRVMAEDPTLYARHLKADRHYLEDGATITVEAFSDNRIVAAMALPIRDITRIVTHPLVAQNRIHAQDANWTDRTAFEHHYDLNDRVYIPLSDGGIRWTAPAGRWCVVVFRQQQTNFCPAYCKSGYVDLLNAKTTKTFIRLTHEQYHRRFKEHFGRTILGFFTDEPGFYNNFLDHNPGTLPWTDDLPEQFLRRRGYDLVPILPALWEDHFPGAAQVRADYWQTISDLFEERFTGQLADWCAAHDVQLTGHLLIEESILAMQRFCGNPFSVLRPLQVTGVDRIDEQNAKISEKLAASIGHANGRQRILSETFALIGWKLAPPYMKRIIDFQYVRGVNWLVPHAFYYTIEDWRRMECPPSLFFQNPWWDHSKPLWEYVSRLSAVLSQGRHVAPVALYYPMEQAQTTVNPESSGPTRSVYPAPYMPFELPVPAHPVELTDAALNRLAFALTGAQYDFDLVDHQLMGSAAVSGTMLRIGDEDFRAVVVPPVRSIHAAALVRMLRFAHEGGLVLFAGELPSIVLDGMVEEWAIARPLLTALHESGTVAWGRGSIGFVPAGEAGVLSLLSRLIRPDVRIVPNARSRERYLSETQHAQFRETRYPKRSESIAYHRRRFPDADVYFLVNENEHSLDVTIDLAGGPAVEEWRPLDGQRHSLSSHRMDDGFTRVGLHFGPGESRLVVLQAGAAAPEMKRETLWKQSIDGWTLKIAGRQFEGELTSWHELGMPSFSGKGAYQTRFKLPPVAPGTRLEIDLGLVLETARIRLNGADLPPMAFAPYRADITERVVAGENEIVVEVANSLLNVLEHIERPSGMLGPVEIRALTGSRSTS